MTSKVLRFISRLNHTALRHPHAMASASVAINGRTVPVHIPPSIGNEKWNVIRESKIFTDWSKNLNQDINVQNIHIQSLDLFGQKIGFLKMQVEAYYKEKKIPGVILLRGGCKYSCL